jgi:hypothetical protein
MTLALTLVRCCRKFVEQINVWNQTNILLTARAVLAGEIFGTITDGNKPVPAIGLVPFSSLWLIVVLPSVA